MVIHIRQLLSVMSSFICVSDVDLKKDEPGTFNLCLRVCVCLYVCVCLRV